MSSYFFRSVALDSIIHHIKDKIQYDELRGQYKETFGSLKSHE